MVEDHGQQLHMKFGADKCKLLISARPKMVKRVERMLNDEPQLLTFFGTPVQTVGDFYVHIGVPQAPYNQSKVMADYRIEKATDMSYLLQGATRHTLAGVSPLSNRKMFLAYHQPSFLYGTDTMSMNEGDVERLEVKYRKILKCMLA